MSFSFYYIHFLCVFCFRNNHFLISNIFVTKSNIRKWHRFDCNLLLILAVQLSILETLKPLFIPFLQSKSCRNSLYIFCQNGIYGWENIIFFSFLRIISCLKCGCCCYPQKHDIDLFMFAWEICLRKYCFYFVSISFIFLICKKYKKVFFFAKWINDAKFVFHIRISE